MGNLITSVRNKMEREIKRVNDQKMAPVPKIPLEVTPLSSTALYSIAKFDYVEPESGAIELCHPLAFPPSSGLSSQPRHHPDLPNNMPSPDSTPLFGPGISPVPRDFVPAHSEEEEVDWDLGTFTMLPFSRQPRMQFPYHLMRLSVHHTPTPSVTQSLPPDVCPTPHSEREEVDWDLGTFTMLPFSRQPHMQFPYLMRLSVHHTPSPLGQSLPPDVCPTHVGPHPHLIMEMHHRSETDEKDSESGGDMDFKESESGSESGGDMDFKESESGSEVGSESCALPMSTSAAAHKSLFHPVPHAEQEEVDWDPSSCIMLPFIHLPHPLMRQSVHQTPTPLEQSLPPDVCPTHVGPHPYLTMEMQTLLQRGSETDETDSESGGDMGFKESESGRKVGSESYALPILTSAAATSHSEQEEVDWDLSSFTMLPFSHQPDMQLPHPLVWLSVHQTPSPLEQSLPPDVCPTHVGPHPYLTMEMQTLLQRGSETDEKDSESGGDMGFKESESGRKVGSESYAFPILTSAAATSHSEQEEVDWDLSSFTMLPFSHQPDMQLPHPLVRLSVHQTPSPLEQSLPPDVCPTHVGPHPHLTMEMLQPGSETDEEDSESGGEMVSESFALPSSTPIAAHKSLFHPIPHSEQTGLDWDPSSFIMLPFPHLSHIQLHLHMQLSVHHTSTSLEQSVRPDVCSIHVGPHPHLTKGIWTTIGILPHPKMPWPPSSSCISSVQTNKSPPQHQLNNNRLSEAEDEHQKRNWNRNSEGGGGKFHRRNSYFLLPDTLCPTLPDDKMRNIQQGDMLSADKWPGMFPISLVNLDFKQKTHASKYCEDWWDQEENRKETFSAIV